MIHCSVPCKELLDKLGGYHLEERGLVDMKVGQSVNSLISVFLSQSLPAADCRVKGK